ncbi:MAG: hypothetical protein GVY30_09710, partial [Chloroflexi bacterium]|nr:hypothetical protein [Chloroflexota bacterium]
MMYAQVSRIVRCTILGLSLVVLFFLLMPTAVTGQATERVAAAVVGNSELGIPPTAEATLSPALERPAPASTTLVIWYQGPAVPSALMRALDELQRAGQVEAIDIEALDEASGRIFVLGQEEAIRTLADLKDVVAITWEGDVKDVPDDSAGDRADEPAPPSVSASPAPQRPPTYRARAPRQAPTPAAPISVPEPDSPENASFLPMDTSRSRLRMLGQPESEPPPVTTSEPAPQAITANGFITGIVTADDGGAPLENVSVCAYQNSPYVHECNQTDASGVYSISVPGGSYQIQFEPENHYISEYYDDVPLHEYNSYDPVTVSDDTATPNINASLAPGFQVIGRVTEEASGDPLSGIAIYIERLPNGDYWAGAYTDANGVYTTTPGVPAGSYRVVFTDYSGIYAKEYYTDVYRIDLATPVEITSTHRTGIDAALVPAAIITGVVTGPGSAPLNDIRAYVYYSDTYSYASGATTDITGTYRVVGLGPVAYKLRFQDNSGQYLTEWHQDKPDWDTADPVALTSGVTTTVDAELTPAGVVTGTITAEGSGAPLENVNVTIYEAATGDSVKSGTTNVSGTYHIGGLISDSYKLRFYDNSGAYLAEYYDDKPDLGSADPFSVTAGVTTTINAELTPAGIITGTVTAEGSGLPLENVNVTTYEAATGDY